MNNTLLLLLLLLPTLVVALFVTVRAWYFRFQTTTLEEVDLAHAKGSMRTATDAVWESPDGYSIKIPEGYYCALFKSGKLLLSAVKQPSSNIAISRYWLPGNWKRSVRKGCDELINKNPTYSFVNEVEFTVGSTTAIRHDFTVNKQGVKAMGVVVWFRIRHTAYIILLNCPEQDFKFFSPGYEKIIESLTVH